MGYDMRAYRPTPEMVAAATEARGIFNQAVKARDAVMDSYPEQNGPRGAGETWWEMTKDKYGGLPAGWELRTVGREEIAGVPAFLDAQQAVIETMAVIEQATGYFRLNISGMGAAREIMARAGMIHDRGESDAPPWTEDETECQLCEASYERDNGHDTDVCRIEREPRLSWAPEHPGIPVWKLGSNDGWLVGPIECRSALDAWEKLDAIEQVELVANFPTRGGVPWWPDWISYLERMAGLNGFLVH